MAGGAGAAGVAMSDDVSEQIQALTIARAYFVEGKTKSEVGKAFGLSRFKVARVIDECLESGLVEIVFHYPRSHVDYELSAALKSRFRLRHAIVVSDAGLTDDSIVKPIGKATADLLHAVSTPDDVLGFAWTRTMEAMSGQLKRLKAKAVVQLCGAFPGAADGRTSIEIVRDVARAVDGPAYFYYAPLVTSDPAAADALRRQPDIARAEGMYPRVTKALVTIGAWKKGQSTVWGAVDAELREAITRAGAVAEMCGGIYLDRSGRPLDDHFGTSCIGIRADALRRVPDVIGIAFGAPKAEAVHAAIRGKIVNSLVVHTAIAKALLSLDPGG